MKNKKKGMEKDSWVVDCRIDGAFNFALQVLKEAENVDYDYPVRANFIKIAFQNSCETLAKVQSTLDSSNLKSAVKLFNKNLKKITACAKELSKVGEAIVQFKRNTKEELGTFRGSYETYEELLDDIENNKLTVTGNDMYYIINTGSVVRARVDTSEGSPKIVWEPLPTINELGEYSSLYIRGYNNEGLIIQSPWGCPTDLSILPYRYIQILDKRNKENKYPKIEVIQNPYDFPEINYEAIENVFEHPELVNEENSEYIKNHYSNYIVYNFPKIYLEYSAELDITPKAVIMPTMDVKCTLPAFIKEYIFDIAEPYPAPIHRPEDIQTSFSQYIENPIKKVPKDRLLELPYDSFDEVINLISTASKSKNVSEIWMTLYRIGSDSRLIDAIIDATNNNISCYLYIELTARGEFSRDIEYLDKLLDKANLQYLHIKFKYNDIKVHAKMIYIKIQEPNKDIGIFSTGNYNEDTVGFYKDYHYISTNENVIKLIKRNFDTIWSSNKPILSSISSVLTKEIYAEIEKGKKGRIWIQANHVDNKHIVTLLKEAIRRGCDVKLIVRTTKGFHKKHLKVAKTIVGPYLEHARVYIFGKGKNKRVYISSSDIMYRNLYNRFESYVEIQDKKIANKIKSNFDKLYKTGKQ